MVLGLLSALPAAPGRADAVPQPKTADNDGLPWQETFRAEGTATFKREVPGSDIIALRGLGRVDAPIMKVASVLLDYTRASEWVDSLVDVHIVRWTGPLEFIEYDRIGTPPLIMKDRDFVCRGKLELDLAKQTLIMHVWPTTDAAVPVDDRYVRGELTGYWRLKAIDGGKHTLVTAEMHGDPKGGVPKWLVNMFQTDWARETLEALRKQVSKSDIAILPQVQAAFEGKPFELAIKSK
jgi:hypothetical protein